MLILRWQNQAAIVMARNYRCRFFEMMMIIMKFFKTFYERNLHQILGKLEFKIKSSYLKTFLKLFEFDFTSESQLGVMQHHAINLKQVFVFSSVVRYRFAVTITTTFIIEICFFEYCIISDK